MPILTVVAQLEPSHLAQLHELLAAARATDGHDPIGEHKFLRLKQRDDLAVAMLAYDAGNLAGYAHTLAYEQPHGRRVSCEYVVHPDQRGRGIESQLIAAAIDHALTQAATQLDLWAYNDSTTSQGAVARFGFQPQRRLLHLHRHTRELPAVKTPVGLSVRGFCCGSDEETVVRLNRQIFADHPEQGTWTMDDLAVRMRQSWFSPADLLLLEHDGQPIGFCWLKIEQRGEEGLVGEIYVIGIAPEARGLGAGRYLLAKALQRLAEHSARVAAVYVDESNLTAVRLYEASGFHAHHVDVCYTLDLTAAARDHDEAAA